MRSLIASTVFVFTVTIFASATLLFQVQPMIAKMILPKFGGTPAVWNTCMVFFQAMLLAGYAYAHAVTTWLTPRRQVIFQMVLLSLPLVTLVLPIRVDEGFVPGEENQVFWLLWLLAISVGLPFLVISTSSPLLQKWFSTTGDPSAHDPYFLYAASNVGSMVSLFGYPVLMEPWLALNAQGWTWTVGYVGLLGLTAWCATRVWRATEVAAAPALALAGVPAMAEAEMDNDEPAPRQSSVAVKGKRKKKKASKGTNGYKESVRRDLPLSPALPPVPEAPTGGSLEQEAMSVRPTLRRYIYWILLSFVPSSLMLAVTTYLTTDIASIPLLWLPPLTLYLLTFIIVFSKFDFILDPVFNFFGLVDTKQNNFLQPGYFSTLAWRLRRFGLHQTMVLAMPVVVLLLVFRMVSDIRLGSTIFYDFALHLTALFVVAMVCHGELARTRPSTEYLTGFYLAMSFGGMLGGVFTAIVAPQAFIGIAEYPLVLVLVCLLLPAFEQTADSPMNWWIDIGLATALGLGALYALVRFSMMDFSGARPWETVFGNETTWLNVSLVVLIVAAMLRYAIGRSKAGEDQLARWLDIGLPIALCILSAQLIYRSPFRNWEVVVDVAKSFNIAAFRLVTVLTFGLPVALCYGFAERPVRFGLGVAAIFLAAAFNSGLHNEGETALHRYYFQWGTLPEGAGLSRTVDLPLHQERSFFGVLKVEARVQTETLRHRRGEEVFETVDPTDAYHRLLHGTTLHGQQRRIAEMTEVGAIVAPLGGMNTLDLLTPYALQGYFQNQRNEALTYYHRTGPVGQLYEAACGTAPCNVAFVGLGTGTMASYVEPGQKATFYEIDPAVIRIAKDQRYFTYLRDCRGEFQFDIGDARLKMRSAPDHGYKIIVVDAFSSDAIPVHLITEQALKMYFEKLEPDGILAIHISNRHLELGPVLGTLASSLGKVALNMYDNKEEFKGKNTSDWVAIANNREAFKNLKAVTFKAPSQLEEKEKETYAWKALPSGPPATHWTDDYSNILSVLRWR